MGAVVHVSVNLHLLIASPEVGKPVGVRSLDSPETPIEYGFQPVDGIRSHLTTKTTPTDPLRVPLTFYITNSLAKTIEIGVLSARGGNSYIGTVILGVD